jgi:nitrogen fixation protein NifB
VIRPDEALDIVRRAVDACPEISVVGIAGPGDTLVTPYALDTLRRVGAEFPDLLKCLSTNGLLLADKADEVIDTGVDSLTVTVNAVDPNIAARLLGRVFYRGRCLFGAEGAATLIRSQLEGIRAVTGAGVTVKVNTVLVPGINDAHVGDIARAVVAAGASIYNLIPLIPRHELADRPAPTCLELEAARAQAGEFIEVFRHCKHCRADAAGIPGVSEFGAGLYAEAMAANTFSHG